MTPLSKLFSLLLGCAFLLPSANAQVSFGIKGGTNIAEHSFKEQGTTINRASINGFTLGAVLEIGLSENVFVQPEAVFVQKGSELEAPTLGEKINVNYIDIPVLLKVKLLNTKLINVNLLGGPSFGLALNGEETDANNQTIDINFGGEDGFRRFELGINAGGGVGVNLGSIGVFGDVRYLFGVSNISDDANREIKNKGLNLSVGLMFKIFG